MKNKIYISLFIIGFCCFITNINAQSVNLRCNYMLNPIGIDKTTPVLSWENSSKDRNWSQTAYQIIVASNAELLTQGKADIWDSGKQKSNESVNITYLGKKPESGKRYYWAVKVWDAKGKPSAWSESAYWEMGLLNPSDWDAKWITNNDPNEKADYDNIRWIWAQEPNDVPAKGKAIAWFRVELNLVEIPMEAIVQTVVTGNYSLYVNGKEVNTKAKWESFDPQNIKDYLIPGINTIDVKAVTNRRKASPNAKVTSAFAGLLKITEKNGEVKRYPTSSDAWKSRPENESGYKPSVVVAEFGDKKIDLNPGSLSKPASLFRKDFNLNKTIKSARLYVTALGSYRMFINGNRVGNDVLTPEFTEYSKRITYQTYDVTSLLKDGENTVGAMLGNGWYGSPLAWTGSRNYFGTFPNSLLAEIQILYNDGTQKKISTDNLWKADRSPIVYSELYCGEYYDARLEQDGWNNTGFNDKSWNSTSIVPVVAGKLSGQINKPVSVVLTVKPQSRKQFADSTCVIDMGQNMAGWAKLKVSGKAGTAIKLRFSELVNTDGTINQDNLRNASATDVYVLKGKGEETFTPSFTFHGFRYIEVSGYQGVLPEDAVVAEVISSVDELTGSFTTSSDLVNKMYSLGIWGQRSNFISVPTDCPQRDERLGYTGDGQVFWRTGTYNFNVAAFTNKWLLDMTDEQTSTGAFTNTAPGVPKDNKNDGSPGWEDAGVIVPWSVWMQFGDKNLVLKNWDNMQKYMDYVLAKSKNYIRPGGLLGDWLSIGKTPNDLLATSLWATSAQMMSQMATSIGKEEDAKKYDLLYNNIRSAFQQTFIKSNGMIATGSQASYIFALHAGLVPESLKKAVTDSLVKDIEEHNWHLTTGFIATPYLLSTLSDNGRSDVAYRLLINETYPSWGYMIKNGATTWWEHWDSDKSSKAMNSFNHYAFGSVCEWIYKSMVGIDTDPKHPGFKKIVISPMIDKSGKITHAKGEYQSVYGKISSEWGINSNGSANLKVTIPANTSAKISIPAEIGSRVIESGKKLKTISEDGKMIFNVGSGTYVFVIE